jgi:peptide/nickel transport system ATP-binding protein
MTSPLVQFRDLSLSFASPRGPVRALRRVNLTLPPRRIVGLVGESGSGKSTLALALMGLLPTNATAPEGAINYKGRDILALPEAERRQLRGGAFAMIFQDPMTALNPVLTIGAQMVEAQRNRHPELGRSARRARAKAMLDRVGLSDPEARLAAYPHQLSGGMRQRVMIAMALLCEPDVLIADEPTTALDVTVEAQIADLLRALHSEFAGAILFVSHSLGLIAELCQEVAVMYAGEIVEVGPVSQVFAAPAHPYTRALLACEIAPDDDTSERLRTIPGELPDLVNLPNGCIFAARCDRRHAACAAPPPLRRTADGRSYLCWLE